MIMQELEKHIRNLRCVDGVVYYEVSVRNVWYKAQSDDVASYERIKYKDALPNKSKWKGVSYHAALNNLFKHGKPEKDWEGKKVR